MAIAQFEAAAGQRQAADQQGRGRAPPTIPLTLRGMHGSRHRRARPDPLLAFRQCLLCWHWPAFRCWPAPKGRVYEVDEHDDPDEAKPRITRLRTTGAKNSSAHELRRRRKRRHRKRTGWGRRRLICWRWREERQTAAPARVAKAAARRPIRALPASAEASAGDRPAGAPASSSDSGGSLLAAGADPDRDRRPRGDLDRRRRDPAAAPATAATASSRPRRAEPMATATMRQRKARARLSALALALAVLGCGRVRGQRAALPAQLLGRRAAVDPTAEQFQPHPPGRRRKHPHRRSTGARCSRSGAARSTGPGPTRWSNARPRPASTCCRSVDRRPELGGAGRATCPAAGGAKAPAHLPASGAARRRLEELPRRRRSSATAPAATSGPTHPDVPARPIRVWQIWNEPNFKYFVAKPNPEEYGKLVKLSYAGDQGADPGAQADPRRPLRAAEGQPAPGDDRQEDRLVTATAATTSPATSSNRCTRATRGSSRSSTASRCTPTRPTGTS